MSRHARTRRPAPDAEHPSLALQRPFRQDAPSHDPAHHAGHDFRRVSVFPAAAVQRKGDGGAAERGDVPVAAGGGEAIPDSVRAAMEGAFAQDFGGVRVHTGPEAKRVGALAYTRGSDLHFQPGRYDPFSDTGRSLLGHELAHVVQQRAGRVAAPSQSKAEGSAPINADAGLEAEADAQGAKAARGERATVSGAGSGVQRKAQDAPIQREKDEEERKYYQMDAPKRPNEFLPNRSVLPPVNNSPERGKTRKNVNGTTFQPDVPRVQTFANRMAGEMTDQKNMLAQNDNAAIFPIHPLSKPGPRGWEGFQTQQRQERDRELGALAEGKTVSKPGQSGIIEANGAANPWSARPLPTKTAMNPMKYVTQGTVEGATPYKGGGGDKTVTRSGPTNSRLGYLENRLNNPQHDPNLRDNQGYHNFPREPIAVRQQHLMQTAQKADPLMRQLDDPINNNKLPNHVDKNNRLDNNGFLFNGDRVGGGTLNNNANQPYYAVGAKQYGNREEIVPELTGPHVVPTVANETQSRTNLWSEADVDKVKVTGTGVQNGGPNHNRRWANLANRGTDRLLHTAANSQALTPNGSGGMSAQNVDSRYSVTNDHYKTAVPISPVAQGYKNNLPVDHPYKASGLDAPLATGASGPTRNSLNAFDTQEAKRIKDSTGDDNMLRMLASQSLRDQAGAEAKTASINRNADERERVTVEGMVEDHLSVQAGRDAEKASYNRNADERERVKMEGVIEDSLSTKALSDAKTASAKREAEEEARTQADLKAFAPSDSIQSMYGMGKGGAEKWAAQQMEQQHLGVQEFLKSGDTKEPTPPMSESAMSMYS